MTADITDFLKQVGNVVPSKRQLDGMDLEFYAFIHFSPNTYTGLEWGLGNEDPAIFNPVNLNCDQWVEAIKSAGMKGAILTAKHHDGFCLWPTKTTEHCIRNSPYKNGKGDIVREFVDACRRGGIQAGLYLSPWDRNASCYGTPEYNDMYCAQLTELLTGYGDLFEIWQDGACGEGPTGKKQVYDFERFNALIRKYQPNACIFNDHGPDKRWCGNEEGTPRPEEWAVVPSELCDRCEVQTEAGPLTGDLSYMYNTDKDVGSLGLILHSKGLVFAPSEIDMSIRPGWFYHENESPHSLERLLNTWLISVGANASFNLNIPPMPNGLFDARDVKRLKELGAAIRENFGTNLAGKYSMNREENGEYQTLYTVRFPEVLHGKYIELREDIAKGQRVESFIAEPYLNGQRKYPWICGKTIGRRHIYRLERAADFNELRIRVIASRGISEINDIRVY